MTTRPRSLPNAARPAMRQRPLRLLLAAATALVALSAGTVAVASTPSHASSRPAAIRITTVLTSTSRISAGLGGVGDLVSQVFSFSLPDGASGHIDASVTVTSASEQLSHVAFVFPNGQIDAQAAITLPPTHFVAAITGGTEAYEGVGGQVDNTVTSTNPLTIHRTLHLIYPQCRQ
jgi:hypothetical protein